MRIVKAVHGKCAVCRKVGAERLAFCEIPHTDAHRGYAAAQESPEGGTCCTARADEDSAFSRKPNPTRGKACHKACYIRIVPRHCPVRCNHDGIDRPNALCILAQRIEERHNLCLERNRDIEPHHARVAQSAYRRGKCHAVHGKRRINIVQACLMQCRILYDRRQTVCNRRTDHTQYFCFPRNHEHPSYLSHQLCFPRTSSSSPIFSS